MPTIKSLSAMEILDSRGRPTVQATCEFSDGVRATASIPSGASTGKAEALELRDGDKKRYHGRGCQKAVANVNETIAAKVRGKSFERQQDLDNLLSELDGTENKSRLGANATLAVSIAFARAHALQLRKPLYQHFADILGRPTKTLPRMTINLFSGGKHAGGQVDIQDVLIVPMSAKTIDEGLAMTYAVYQAAAAIGLQRYNMRALTADEGGLAPPFTCCQAMLDDAVAAIEAAGLKPGADVKIAVDVASSHFYENGRYRIDGENLDPAGMIEKLNDWVKQYPIISVEDGLSEEDWANWPQLRKTLGDRVLVLGDDLLCTNPARIKRAIETNSATALLLKVNQIGSLSDAAVACRLAQDAKWAVTVSARSGETEDNWLADLSVGWSGNQIKVGSIAHSERLAKYNRLLEIESETRYSIADFGLKGA